MKGLILEEHVQNINRTNQGWMKLTLQSLWERLTHAQSIKITERAHLAIMLLSTRNTRRTSDTAKWFIVRENNH